MGTGTSQGSASVLGTGISLGGHHGDWSRGRDVGCGWSLSLDIGRSSGKNWIHRGQGRTWSHEGKGRDLEPRGIGQGPWGAEQGLPDWDLLGAKLELPGREPLGAELGSRVAQQQGPGGVLWEPPTQDQQGAPRELLTQDQQGAPQNPLSGEPPSLSTGAVSSRSPPFAPTSVVGLQE